MAHGPFQVMMSRSFSDDTSSTDDEYCCIPCFGTELDSIYTRGGEIFLLIEEHTLHFREPFVLEILRDHQMPAGESIVQDGPCIGIRKSALAQAYFYASTTFQSLGFAGHEQRRMWFCFMNHDASNPSNGDGDARCTPFISSTLILLTSIMLLHDPEHAVATNARKKALLAQSQGFPKPEHHMIEDPWGIMSGSGWASGNPELCRRLFQDALDQDFLFSDSLLTSPLHKHSKSPNLWSHRKWLVKLRLAHGHPTADLALGELRHIVMRAAETHPRNYHAWAYMRWIISLDRSPRPPAAAAAAAKSTRPASKPGKTGSILSPWVHRTMVEEMVTWCLQHPSDTSGWSFLSHVLCPAPVGAAPLGSTGPAAAVALLAEKFAGVLGLARRWKWRHESVWVFLRTLASSEHVGDELRCAFLRAIKETVEDRSRDGGHDFTHLMAAENWCREYGPVSRLEEIGVLF